MNEQKPTEQPTAIPLDELHKLVGKDIGPGEWLTVTQDQVDRFADLTDDHQFIHTDPERAARSELGSTVAHGFFILSLGARLLAESGMQPTGTKIGFNYGLNRVRFITPVRTGCRIRGWYRPLSFEQRCPGEILGTFEIRWEIEGDEKPALVAEQLVLYRS